MSDLQQLIEMADQLSNRLENMANDEIKFGWQFGNLLESMAYETFIISNNLKELNSQLVGGVI